MRVFILARHGESVLNVQRLVNGDPAVPGPLSEAGAAQARSLGEQVANIPLDVCVHTSFGRTRETAELAVGDSGVPFLEEPLLDDVKVGELEGSTVDEYRAWKRRHTRRDRFPGGESLDEAATRFAAGLESVLRLPDRVVLVVTHEIPIRYALNAVAGSSELDAPTHDIRNCVPYLFDEPALEQAIAWMRELGA
jgi:broad specificity phosphatase PhoE